jgi:hypothetical protein
VYVDLYTTLALTNTVVSGHSSVGVRVMAFSTATLDATLWYGNLKDTGGVGTILTGTVNVYGDPAFVDPSAGDYHIDAASAAVDAGINAGVDEDIDGDPRPSGDAFDIGADEYRWHRVHLPLIQKDWLRGPSVEFSVRAPEFPSD